MTAIITPMPLLISPSAGFRPLLLGMAAMRRLAEGCHRHGLDGIDVVGRFGADDGIWCYRHGMGPLPVGVSRRAT